MFCRTLPNSFPVPNHSLRLFLVGSRWMTKRMRSAAASRTLGPRQPKAPWLPGGFVSPVSHQQKTTQMHKHTVALPSRSEWGWVRGERRIEWGSLAHTVGRPGVPCCFCYAIGSADLDRLFLQPVLAVTADNAGTASWAEVKTTVSNFFRGVKEVFRSNLEYAPPTPASIPFQTQARVPHIHTSRLRDCCRG